MNIRPEHPDDYAAILRLTCEAFLTLDYPGRRRVDEHYLICLLRRSPFVISELCFVAEENGEVVGHILYTKSEVLRPDGTKLDTITFGPLSVLPERHKQGVGAALVRHSMEKAQEMGFGAVLITGVPDYYPKLGFGRARDYGLTLPDGTSDDPFMAYELQPGYLTGGGTLRFLPPEFEQSEKDDSGFESFHQQFMAEHYPARLMLRPLFDGDIALMERWLHEPHVAKWYQHPDHWLNELHERRGEFSFLTHFIAELEGVPIGFCQYYDTFCAQQHEVWNDEWRVGEKQGEIFSIDYLIGEPDYLRRGFGKEMIAQMLDVLRKIGAKTVIVEPERDNTASNRTLEANGFTRIGGDYRLELGEMIKKIGNDELRQALDLVNKVFSEFVAVDYSERGRKTFSDYLQSKYDEMSADLLSGHKKIWGYYEGEKIVGVIATRNISHIALMFVDKEYHKKGIAKQLFSTVLKEIMTHSNADIITVNSSPYAAGVYERLGFVKTGDMQERDGILFIPMEYRIWR